VSVLSYFHERTILIVFVGPVSSVWFVPQMVLSLGELVMCKADGYPRPTFHWIRTMDNATVADGPELVVESANYICIATNTVRKLTYTAMSSELHYAAAAAAAGISRQLPHIIDSD